MFSKKKASSSASSASGQQEQPAAASGSFAAAVQASVPPPPSRVNLFQAKVTLHEQRRLRQEQQQREREEKERKRLAREAEMAELRRVLAMAQVMREQQRELEQSQRSHSQRAAAAMDHSSKRSHSQRAAAPAVSSSKRSQSQRPIEGGSKRRLHPPNKSRSERGVAGAQSSQPPPVSPEERRLSNIYLRLHEHLERSPTPPKREKQPGEQPKEAEVGNSQPPKASVTQREPKQPHDSQPPLDISHRLHGEPSPSAVVEPSPPPKATSIRGGETLQQPSRSAPDPLPASPSVRRLADIYERLHDHLERSPSAKHVVPPGERPTSPLAQLHPNISTPQKGATAGGDLLQQSRNEEMVPSQQQQQQQHPMSPEERRLPNIYQRLHEHLERSPTPPKRQKQPHEQPTPSVPQRPPPQLQQQSPQSAVVEASTAAQTSPNVPRAIDLLPPATSPAERRIANLYFRLHEHLERTPTPPKGSFPDRGLDLGGEQPAPTPKEAGANSGGNARSNTRVQHPLEERLKDEAHVNDDLRTQVEALQGELQTTQRQLQDTRKAAEKQLPSHWKDTVERQAEQLVQQEQALETVTQQYSHAQVVERDLRQQVQQLQEQLVASEQVQQQEQTSRNVGALENAESMETAESRDTESADDAPIQSRYIAAVSQQVQDVTESQALRIRALQQELEFVREAHQLELEGYQEQLERAKAALGTSLALANSSNDKETQLQQALEEARRELKQHEQQSQAKEEQLQALQLELEEAHTKQSNSLGRELASAGSDESNTSEAIQRALRESQDILAEKEKQWTFAAKSKEAEMHSLKIDLEQARNELHQVQQQTELLQKELQVKTGELEETQEQLLAAEAAINSHREMLQKEVNVRDSQLDSIQEQLSNAQERAQELEQNQAATIQDLQERVQTLQQELEQSALEKFERGGAAAATSSSNLNESVSSASYSNMNEQLESDLQEARRSLQVEHDRNQLLSSQVEELTTHLEKRSSQLLKLQKLVKQKEAYLAADKATIELLKSQMEMENTNNENGAHHNSSSDLQPGGANDPFAHIRQKRNRDAAAAATQQAHSEAAVAPAADSGQMLIRSGKRRDLTSRDLGPLLADADDAAPCGDAAAGPAVPPSNDASGPFVDAVASCVTESSSTSKDASTQTDDHPMLLPSSFSTPHHGDADNASVSSSSRSSSSSSSSSRTSKQDQGDDASTDIESDFDSTHKQRNIPPSQLKTKQKSASAPPSTVEEDPPETETTPTSATSTVMEHELDLDKVDLLRGLDDATRGTILQCLEFHEYTPGSVVFEQHSTGQSLYFLEEGVVDVVVDGDIVVDHIQEGSVFGELALLLSMPRTATIRAATLCIAFELNRPAFEAVAASSPVLKQRLEQIKEERWARFRKDLEAAVLHPNELSSTQRAYLLEVFKQIDADGSGAIDEDELAIMLKRLAGHAFAVEDVHKMMETLDKDGNGTIEAEEFLVGLPLLAKWLVDKETMEEAPDAPRTNQASTRLTAYHQNLAAHAVPPTGTGEGATRRPSDTLRAVAPLDASGTIGYDESESEHMDTGLTKLEQLRAKKQAKEGVVVAEIHCLESLLNQAETLRAQKDKNRKAFEGMEQRIELKNEQLLKRQVSPADSPPDGSSPTMSRTKAITPSPDKGGFNSRSLAGTADPNDAAIVSMGIRMTSMQATIESLLRQLETRQQEQEALQQRLDAAVLASNEALEARPSSPSSVKDDTLEQIATLTEQVQSLQKELKETEARLADAMALVESLTTQLQEAQQKSLSSLDAGAAAASAGPEVLQLQMQVARLEKELETKQGALDTDENTLVSLRRKLEKTEEYLSEEEDLRDEVQKDLDDLIRNHQQSVFDLSEKIKSFRTALRETEAQLAEANEKVEELTEDLEVAREQLQSQSKGMVKGDDAEPDTFVVLTRQLEEAKELLEQQRELEDVLVRDKEQALAHASEVVLASKKDLEEAQEALERLQARDRMQRQELHEMIEAKDTEVAHLTTAVEHLKSKLWSNGNSEGSVDNSCSYVESNASSTGESCEPSDHDNTQQSREGLRDVGKTTMAAKADVVQANEGHLQERVDDLLKLEESVSTLRKEAERGQQFADSETMKALLHQKEREAGALNDTVQNLRNELLETKAIHKHQVAENDRSRANLQGSIEALKALADSVVDLENNLKEKEEAHAEAVSKLCKLQEEHEAQRHQLAADALKKVELESKVEAMSTVINDLVAKLAALEFEFEGETGHCQVGSGTRSAAKIEEMKHKIEVFESALKSLLKLSFSSLLKDNDVKCRLRKLLEGENDRNKQQLDKHDNEKLLVDLNSKIEALEMVARELNSALTSDNGTTGMR